MQQQRYRWFAVSLLVATAAGCSKPESSNVTAPVITDMNALDANMATSDLPTAPNPTPRYQDHEGDRYFYVGAVSDDDKKKGVAVGDVIQYRYLGEIDGKLRLQQVTETGDVIATIECPRDCRIMKIIVGNNVSRQPFDNSSIGGAAMDDALNGFLKPSVSRSRREEPSVPASEENTPVADSNSM